MRRIITGIFILSLSLALKSQVDRAGTVIKISGGEITVRNENPAEPFVMGETLRLLTGDKSVALQVTFAMQSSAKCKLISGSIGNLKIGSLVYSGGMPENSGDSEVKALERTNVKSMKIDDFQTFLGLTNGDTMEKAVQILGKPSKIEKGDGSEYSYDYFDWGDVIEEKCSISIYSSDYSKDHRKIDRIYLSSYDWKYDNNKFKYNFLDTINQGTVHFLRSKGRKDAALDLFGLSPQDIAKIFGNPERISKDDDNKYYSYWYKTSSEKTVSFNFYTDEDKLYTINVYLQ